MATPVANIAKRLGRLSKRILKFRRLILSWFRKEGRSFPWREPDASDYVKVISEVLLQRTRAETVAAFFPRFVADFPSWLCLAAGEDADLGTLLKPIGLWKRRTISLRALGREMLARDGIFPKHRAEIESLPGIGQYIASAVLLFCHQRREPLLDVNMARVLERCFGPRKLVDIRYDPWLQSLSRRVVGGKNAIQLNWGILDLAAKICTIQRPACFACPVRSCCDHALAQKQDTGDPDE